LRSLHPCTTDKGSVSTSSTTARRVAEAIAWSENGNHATIYTMGITAQEAGAKLMGALGELHLVPETSIKTGGSEES